MSEMVEFDNKAEYHAGKLMLDILGCDYLTESSSDDKYQGAFYFDVDLPEHRDAVEGAVKRVGEKLAELLKCTDL